MYLVQLVCGTLGRLGVVAAARFGEEI